MAYLGLNKLSKVIKTISSIENTLIQQIRRNNYREPNYSNEPRNASYNINRKIQRPSFHNNQFRQRNNNWCWFHKTNSHSASNFRNLLNRNRSDLHKTVVGNQKRTNGNNYKQKTNNETRNFTLSEKQL